MNEIEMSLSDLRVFVNTQKHNLIKSEARIKELDEERQRLRPLVEADRNAIESLFLIQEERNQSKVWSERLIGAFFGVLSSLIAALIFRIVTTRKDNSGSS